MRRFAGIGFMLLALGGCQSLPDIVRVEVDGSTLDFKKKEPPATEAPATAPGNAVDPAPSNALDPAP